MELEEHRAMLENLERTGLQDLQDFREKRGRRVLADFQVYRE